MARDRPLDADLLNAPLRAPDDFAAACDPGVDLQWTVSCCRYKER
jgi:hypothetical protein